MLPAAAFGFSGAFVQHAQKTCAQHRVTCMLDCNSKKLIYLLITGKRLIEEGCGHSQRFERIFNSSRSRECCRITDRQSNINAARCLTRHKNFCFAVLFPPDQICCCSRGGGGGGGGEKGSPRVGQSINCLARHDVSSSTTKQRGNIVSNTKITTVGGGTTKKNFCLKIYLTKSKRYLKQKWVSKVCQNEK